MCGAFLRVNDEQNPSGPGVEVLLALSIVDVNWGLAGCHCIAFPLAKAVGPSGATPIQELTGRRSRSGLRGDQLIVLDPAVLGEIEQPFLVWFDKIEVATVNNQFVTKS